MAEQQIDIDKLVQPFVERIAVLEKDRAFLIYQNQELQKQLENATQEKEETTNVELETDHKL